MSGEPNDFNLLDFLLHKSFSEAPILLKAGTNFSLH